MESSGEHNTVYTVGKPITQTTTIIGRNFTDFHNFTGWIQGLIGRGIAHWPTPHMVIVDVLSVQPFFHKFDDLFDVAAVVELQPEEME